LSEVWSAIADPTRRKILQLLRHGELSAGDIAANFDLSQPTVSHHLSVLKQAELVKSRKDEQRIIYSINTSVVEDLMSFFSGLIK
jgi:ArsR family transcriptional regulator